MRRVACLLLALSLATLLSCSEIPTAPRLASVTVTGRVTDRDGPPLQGVRVLFDLETAEPGPPLYKTTDADGRYEIKLPEGIYRVRLDADFRAGYPPITLHGIKVGAAGAVIDYRYTGVRVSGAITGPNATILGEAAVGASGTSAGTYVSAYDLSSTGQYSLLLPAGVYEFDASSDNYESGLPRIHSSQVAVVSDTTIDFALSGFKVTARMTVNGGVPMMGASFQAIGDDADAAARTGLDGVATVYLPAGSYTLRASPYPQNIAGPRAVTRSIQADDALTFDFSGPRWDLTIRRAADDTPFAGAWAFFRDAGHNEGVSLTTDPFGRASCLMRSGTPYDLTIEWIEGNSYGEALFSNLSSAADTTFDFSVNAP